MYLQTLLVLFFSLYNVLIFDQKENIAVPAYKLKNATKVYNNLKHVSQNDALHSMPKLLIETTTNKVAVYRRSKNEIVIEEKLYDICTSYFGKDSLAALAVIMGHELSHFLKGHQSSGFGCKHFKNSPLEKKDILQEKEADIWGMFTAYQVGYDVQEIAPLVFEKVYEGYNLKAKLEGYPHLDIRKRSIKASLQKLKDLIQLFEAANYFTAIGDFENAYFSYQIILEDYQSAEIYNNLGICYALAAISFLDDKKHSLAYPFELNTTSRLYRLRELPFGFDPAQYSKELFQKAKQSFDKAIQHDLDNLSYPINMVCALALQGKFSQAVHYLDQYGGHGSNKDFDPQQKKSMKIIRANLEAELGNINQAKKLFETINHPIADYNFKILEKEVNPKIVLKRKVPIEKMASVSLYRPPLEYDRTLFLQKQEPHFFKYKKVNNHNTTFLLAGEKMDRTYLYLTQDKREKTKLGVKVGMPMRILAKYGNEYKDVSTSSGFIRVYHNQGMIFNINKNNKITEWGIFKID